MVEKKNLQTRTSKKNYNLIDDFYSNILKHVTINSKGTIQLKKSDVKKILEEVYRNASKEAVKGNRVRFPILGILTMKQVPARKAGKQKNPFTGEIVEVPARPASRKPKWSFPKSLKEFFADKKNWK